MKKRTEPPQSSDFPGHHDAHQMVGPLYQPAVSGDRRSPRFLLVVVFAFLLFVTLKSGVQFLRYTLPALPLMLIWASQVAKDRRRHPFWFQFMIVGATLWSIISSLFVFPHCLSYFNEIVGGPRNGYQHLIDDSFDWGQDLLALRNWLDEHPEAKPIQLVYWGWTDPTTAGIEFELPPLKSELLALVKAQTIANENSPVGSLQPLPLKPGWYAISVGHSHGGPWIRLHDGTGHEVITTHGDFDYFRDLSPMATAGYSIRIFYLDENAIAQIFSRLYHSPARAGGF